MTGWKWQSSEGARTQVHVTLTAYVTRTPPSSQHLSRVPAGFKPARAPSCAHSVGSCRRTAHPGPSAPGGVLEWETEAGRVLVSSFLSQSTPQGPQNCLPLLRRAWKSRERRKGGEGAES